VIILLEMVRRSVMKNASDVAVHGHDLARDQPLAIFDVDKCPVFHSGISSLLCHARTFMTPFGFVAEYERSIDVM